MAAPAPFGRTVGTVGTVLPPFRVLAPTSLRIMPLGNSITWGYLSSDGNGWREHLLTALTNNNTPAHYIGSQKSGNMTNNENEGHPGAYIDQIAAFANNSLSQLPNLILLMAGTNDMNDNISVSTAPERLGALIDECDKATRTESGRAVILVAELTPIPKPASETRVQAFNAAIPGLLQSRLDCGMKLMAVNMSQYVTVEDIQDGLHPSDYGYSQMARAWYMGIGAAAAKGWFTAPAPILGP